MSAAAAVWGNLKQQLLYINWAFKVGYLALVLKF
jgi:hypothetical protein